DSRTALVVVIDRTIDPEGPCKRYIIQSLPQDQDYRINFHAGTAHKDDVLITARGRVLCVTALGDSLRRAQEAAYATVTQDHFDGKQFRSDIGWRALKGQSNQ